MNTDERDVLLERLDALAVRVRQLERAGMPASTAIPPSPAAQGDMIAADATPAWGLLSIGNVREILTVNAAGTDPEWKIVDSARARRSSTQSIPDNTITAVSFTNEVHDTGDDNWSIGSPTRLTAQRDGVYIIVGNIRWATNVTGRRFVQIILNGTTVIGRVEFQSGPTGRADMCVSAIYDLSSSDYVELEAFQNSGGALDIIVATMDPWFSIARLT